MLGPIHLPVTQSTLKSVMNFPVRFKLAMITVAFASSQALADDDAVQFEHFRKKIRPLFIEHCFECHAADAKSIEGGLRLDSADAVLAGGDSGPPIVEHVPDDSLLIKAVLYEEDALQMPPIGKLRDSEVADLIKWVEDGAPYPPSAEQPKPAAPMMVAKPETPDLNIAVAFFWLLQPPTILPLPHHTPSDLSPQQVQRIINQLSGKAASADK